MTEVDAVAARKNVLAETVMKITTDGRTTDGDARTMLMDIHVRNSIPLAL
jgi:hypothetical protein